MVIKMQPAENFIVTYWPQVTGVILLVWYVSRHLGDMATAIDRLAERVKQAEAKISDLFRLHNEEVARKLERLSKKDDE